MLAGAVLLVLAGPAAAQLVLPGAVQPTPEGAAQAPPAPTVRHKPKALGNGASAPTRTVSTAVLPATVLAGKTLALNGDKSLVVFEPRDKDVDVARLVLAGELISNNREPCQVEAQATPIAVSHVGRPNGLERIRLDFPACPIAFDVLDGAALVDPAQGACDFVQANCRVSPAGLWGPTPGDLGPDRVKAVERARANAEREVRANYKSLVAATGRDRAGVMAIAREQAQFSSTREETCRDYVGEGRHGFCATKLTEARADVLRVRLGEALQAKAARKAKQRHGRAESRN